MRLKKIWIEQFKNLKSFEIEFDNELTTVVIGGNGTGKSNLLEAMAIIFRDLDLEHKNPDAMPFEYYLIYECRGRQIEIDANPSESRPSDNVQLTLVEDVQNRRRRSTLLIKVNEKSIATNRFFLNKKEFLPNHVFGYYSGPTNRLAQHFIRHQEKFYEDQRQGVDSPLRPLFFALPVHSQFVLLSYFSFPDEGKAFLRERLRITDLESVLFVIKEPDWKRANFPADLFWGAKGIPQRFLTDLYQHALAPIRDKVKVRKRTGKSTDEERLYLYIKDEKVLKLLAERHNSNQEFFKALDTLYIADLIAEVHIRVKRSMGDTDDYITFNELSEGEQQLLTVLGLLKFTRDTESLFLLDEPDTHLNPAWKLEYMRLIEPIVGTDTQCQILLVTHDPIVMGSCVKEQVRVLTREHSDQEGKVVWYEPDKDPQGMGVAALLTSDVYGLRSSLDWQTQHDLDLKRHLASKDPEELTRLELEELQKLEEKLEDLGFTYSMRDPLYALFVEAMATEMEKRPELRKPVLTKDEQELQAELAQQIIGEILNQQNK